MNRPRTSLGKEPAKGRGRLRTRSPQVYRAQSGSPFDAISKGLVSIGEKLIRGRAQHRVP